MMYAIYKTTKRHYDITGNLYASYACAGDDWRIVMGDDDGWIKWGPPKRGSNSPLPDDASVEVLLIRGHRHKGKASDFPWFDTGDGGTVEFYRPTLGAKVSHPGTLAGPDKHRAAGGEPPAWDGEGLPPVGCECEYDDCQHGWVRTRILAHHPNGSCAWHESVEADGFVDETSYSTDSAGAFRPIRSEEDRAVEEMVAIDPVGFTNRDSAVVRDFARELYRAGYRKTGDT